MNFSFNSQSKNILKFSFLAVLYLIFFYFLIFKNILNFFELKEYINKNEIKRKSLSIENEELEKSLNKKKEFFEKRLSNFNSINIDENNKLKFANISEALNTINMYIHKNKIDFISLGRIQKSGSNLINISLSFSTNEDSLINFINDLENSEFYFALNDSHFKIELVERILLTNFNIKFKLTESFEKILINDNKNFKLFSDIENSKISNSYMRIGNNIFYKKSISSKTKGGQKE